MHSRLSTFLNIKDIIYPLQFGFRQNYSTSYALIHLTETIKEALDQGKYGCGIFVDLQKAFDTSYALIYLTKTIKEALHQGNLVVRFLFIFKRLLTLLTITFYWVS